MIKFPPNIEDICRRLETRQALAWQIANELDIYSPAIYRWYQLYRGKPLSAVTWHRRGKVLPHSQQQTNVTQK